MKRIFRFLFAVAISATMISCSKFDDTAIWQAINKHSEEIASLKERCNKFNSDLVSLQQLVGALQGADYITNCTPLADGSGYTIIFKSGKSIVINHGKDGTTPQIGIEKDTDDLYYWTMDGEWLLDKDGNKIKAGGVDGKDGIAPQLKIQDGDWYLSTDGGQKWTKIGKATGEDGKSLFTSVTPGDNYVSFVLSNGTELKVPYYCQGLGQIAITGDFSDLTAYSATLFGWCNWKETEEEGLSVAYGIEYSSSDLTVAPIRIRATSRNEDNKFSCALTGLYSSTKYYYRAYVYFNEQYSFGEVKTFTTPSFPEVVDLGLSVKWRSWNLGANRPEEYGGYYQWAGVKDVTDLSNYLGWADCPYHTGSDAGTGWTKYVSSDKSSYWSGSGSPDNKTILEANDDAAHITLGDKWRMPTNTEMEELKENCTWTWEDNYNETGIKGYKVTSKIDGFSDKFIFLPLAGWRVQDRISSCNAAGYYWTSSAKASSPIEAYSLGLISDRVWQSNDTRNCGLSIRPVYDCPTPDMVDLGLSVKWSSWNLGASKPEEYGGYYQWAGTTDVTKTDRYIDWDTCPYHTNLHDDCETGWLKYIPLDKPSYWSGSGNPDNKTTLEVEDDVAHTRLGDKWRIPTDAEWNELKENCFWEWTNDYKGTGKAGEIVTSKKEGYTDKSIFLPAVGYRDDEHDTPRFVGSRGYYWSSSLDANYYPYDALAITLNSSTSSIQHESRCYGFSVRPVSK